MTTFVYFLTDPRTPRRPRYVGITIDPVAREKRHAFGNTTNGAMGSWKRALACAGLVPRLHVLAGFDSTEAALEAEWRTIDRWRRRGLCDCNTGHEGRLRRMAARSRSTEPAPRFELGTARLRIGCSTTELSRRTATEALAAATTEPQQSAALALLELA